MPSGTLMTPSEVMLVSCARNGTDSEKTTSPAALRIVMVGA